MTDKVQKIKEWISKTQDGLVDANGNFEYPEHEGAYHILCNLDAYIDSLQEEPVSEKKCMFTKDNYTDEDRIVLCENCKEKCEYSKKEGPISEELEEASKEWLRPQLDKSYVNYGKAKMMELTRFDGYAMLDAIEFGAKWQRKQMIAKAIEGKVLANGMGNPILHLWDKGRHLIDKKVKVIVINED